MKEAITYPKTFLIKNEGSAMKECLPLYQTFVVSSCHQTDILNILANQVSSSSNFLFGTSSSCYQYEGAILSDGKGLNNWDVFTHEAGHIKDGSNGDVAVDHYNRYLEDVKLMEDMGVNGYRFSISWARILPKGTFGDVNMAGIEHYSKLIDALLQKGIQPLITLTHYDIPQELEERYGGWLSSQIQDDFSYYADICFKYFGDRVKYWTTINEPNVMAVRGYRKGTYPPARCSGVFGNCSAGDSEREPFIAAHNMILSHAAAAGIYRTRYQLVNDMKVNFGGVKQENGLRRRLKLENFSWKLLLPSIYQMKRQGGMIGISLDTQWYEPFSNSSEDIAATERARSFYVNWFLDPIILGRYPKEMVQILGSNLPDFSKNDLSKLSYGLDFIGINYYTAKFIKDCLYSACEHGNTWSEGSYFVTTEKDGVYIGQTTEVGWLFLYPQGMKKIVMYMKDRFNNTPMVITENGIAENDNLNPSITDTLNDIHRVNYMHSYLNSLANAITEGADVRGYFVWSLLDNFEWLDGYKLRFGLHYVNYTNLERIPKLSATILLCNETSVQPDPCLHIARVKLKPNLYEGAILSDGKGLNNWDVFTHEAGHIKDGSNGDVAVDHYNRYLEDVKLMEDMGVNRYRFSISWARIMPRTFGNVNMAGIEHYNKLIDVLLQKGIQPFITLTHYDIPQELEERYGDICFKYFEDRVKYWTTINEPNVMALFGYRLGTYPPARCFGIFGKCSAGDSERDPFIAAHNMILSHAAAVRIYRTRYQKRQGGMIGIALDIQWYEPFSNSSEDIAAAERARSFYVNWFLDPIILGRYPKEMVQILGSRENIFLHTKHTPNLPDFSKNDLSKLSYGLDFIGINYYTANYIKDCLYSACEHGNTWSEGSYFATIEKDGVFIGQPIGVEWLFLYPQGMKKIVMYMKDKFNNTPMVITENGIAENDNLNPSITDTLNDIHRVNYMHSYLNYLANAIRESADLRGYFVWSLLDNFEWLDGYKLRFGLHFVNYTNLQRTPKLSATRYKQLMYNFNIQLETHTAQN
ncbi:hypothetical protein H5410_008087 [Solanum commersonii]|uniref:Uncharacterized protein n=1 Tax=Solanum commersonii TaxID=4109 RepID=A0A9J6ADY0_SOLCO|nr:hypothetical protein H5410_008087 [Solanum commersonii]